MTINMKRSRYAPRLTTRVAESLDALEEWMGDWPTPWVSISGGKDSLVALDLVRRINPSVPVAWFETDLEFPQTRRYVYGLAKAWGLDLHIYRPRKPLLDVIAASGNWEHGIPEVETVDDLHEVAVGEPLQRALAELGPACVYGVRADEAENRRMYLSRGKGKVVKRRSDGSIHSSHISPAWRWSSEEVFAYIAQHNLPLNPLYRQQMELGVAEHRARVGLIIDGWAVEVGRWAVARALAPDDCRRIEERLPVLAEWR